LKGRKYYPTVQIVQRRLRRWRFHSDCDMASRMAAAFDICFKGIRYPRSMPFQATHQEKPPSLNSLICVLTGHRKTRIDPVVAQKIPLFYGTLIHLAISATLKKVVIVECWSTLRQPFRETSVGFPLHPCLERDPLWM
jgi:hypothetical protein